MKKFLICILALFLTFIFLGCTNTYLYEGYVIDFQSKEAISEAQFNFWFEGKEIITDENGYFRITGELIKNYAAPAYITDITAKSYGKLEWWDLYDKELAKIPLMPANSVYGSCYFEKPLEVEILLKGDTYQETTFCDENGDFYFLNVPDDQDLSLYFYNKGDFNVLYDYREISLKDYNLIYHTVPEENFYN